MAKKFKKFSVLLLYPDWLAETYGEETFYAWVMARGPVAAVKAAQRKAGKVNEFTPNDNPQDFAPLLVIKGHHYGQAMFNK